MNGHGDDALLRAVTVVTPENLEIRYRLAGPASRGLAWSFDSLFQVVGLCLTMVLLSAVASALSFSALGKTAETWVAALQILVAFLVINGYFVFFEVRWNGQTPGKRVLNLRVIREGGYPIAVRESVVRNLLRVVDWLPAFYAVGTLSALASYQSRRLGDYAAGTYVVLEEPPEEAPTPASHSYIPESRQLGPERLELIRTLFARSRWLLPRHRAALAARLAERVAAELELQVPITRSSEGFLADLLVSSTAPVPEPEDRSDLRAEWGPKS